MADQKLKGKRVVKICKEETCDICNRTILSGTYAALTQNGKCKFKFSLICFDIAFIPSQYTSFDLFLMQRKEITKLAVIVHPTNLGVFFVKE